MKRLITWRTIILTDLHKYLVGTAAGIILCLLIWGGYSVFSGSRSEKAAFGSGLTQRAENTDSTDDMRPELLDNDSSSLLQDGIGELTADQQERLLSAQLANESLAKKYSGLPASETTAQPPTPAESNRLAGSFLESGDALALNRSIAERAAQNAGNQQADLQRMQVRDAIVQGKSAAQKNQLANALSSFENAGELMPDDRDFQAASYQDMAAALFLLSKTASDAQTAQTARDEAERYIKKSLTARNTTDARGLYANIMEEQRKTADAKRQQELLAQQEADDRIRQEEQAERQKRQVVELIGQGKNAVERRLLSAAVLAFDRAAAAMPDIRQFAADSYQEMADAMLTISQRVSQPSDVSMALNKAETYIKQALAAQNSAAARNLYARILDARKEYTAAQERLAAQQKQQELAAEQARAEAQKKEREQLAQRKTEEQRKVQAEEAARKKADEQRKQQEQLAKARAAQQPAAQQKQQEQTAAQKRAEEQRKAQEEEAARKKADEQRQRKQQEQLAKTQAAQKAAAQQKQREQAAAQKRAEKQRKTQAASAQKNQAGAQKAGAQPPQKESAQNTKAAAKTPAQRQVENLVAQGTTAAKRKQLNNSVLAFDRAGRLMPKDNDFAAENYRAMAQAMLDFAEGAANAQAKQNALKKADEYVKKAIAAKDDAAAQDLAAKIAAAQSAAQKETPAKGQNTKPAAQQKKSAPSRGRNTGTEKAAPNTRTGAAADNNDAQTHFISAQKADAQNNPALALQELETASRLDSQNYLYSYELGRKYFDQKKYPQARTAFEQTVKANPNYEAGYFNLGITHKIMNANDAALTAFTKAAALKPGYVRAWIEIARIQDKQRKYSEALTNYQKALALEPANLSALKEMAQVYAKQKDNKQAERYFKEALTLGDSDPVTYYNLAAVQLEAGNTTDALQNAQKALAGNSRDARFLYTYGLALEKNNRIKEAEDYYARAAAADGSYSKPRINLGRLQLEAGKLDGAEQNLQAAYRIEPSNFEVNMNLGKLYGLENQYGKAIDFYSTAIKIMPHDMEARQNLAAVYLSAGLKENARDTYQSSIKMNAQAWDSYYELGKVYISMDNKSEAKAIFEQLLRQRPNYRYAAEIRKVLGNL
ncbi:tetratricopeptide repeat protein [Treponema sp.]|uniref:tetratricopeptide repeat protein n=1 Tax=Treponema sp. TaxID=166 RepID=UPI003FA1BFE6